jgi:hypothetical protein
MSADATAITRRSNRSQSEWDALALGTIVPMLQDGTKMTEIRDQFGAGPTIRRALSRVGYNTKGQQVKVVGTVKVARVQPKVLAKRIAERRENGAAWWRLELETGKQADELRVLLAEHGYTTTGMVAGRMVISERGQRKAAKAAELAAAEAAAAAAKAKPARKPRAKRTVKAS